MSFYTGNSPKLPTKYTGPGVYLNSIVSRNREPLGTDYRQPETGRLYPIGSEWIIGTNPTTGTQGDKWYLSKIVANVAYWVRICSCDDSLQVIRGPEVDFVNLNTTAIAAFESDFVLCGGMTNVTAITGSAFGGSGAYNLGWTAPNYDDIVSGCQEYATQLNFQNGYFTQWGFEDCLRIPAGETLMFKLTLGDSTATELIERIDIIGYSYN